MTLGLVFCILMSFISCCKWKDRCLLYKVECGTEFNFFFVVVLLSCFTLELLYSFMFCFILLGQKACVEIDVTRGAWRDVGCGEYRPFICKKSMGEWSSFVTGMWLLL